MKRRLPRAAGTIRIIVAAALAVQSCAALSEAATTPLPEAWRSQLHNLLAAFDAGDEAAVATLFSSRAADRLAPIFPACSTIPAKGRRLETAEERLRV